MKNLADVEISDLEREIELEMDDSAHVEQEIGYNSDVEQETDDDRENREFEGIIENIEDSEFELESDQVLESEAPDEFAQRFYELSNREFEDESDLDREIGGLLNEMERQYFWGGLKGLVKKGLKFGGKQLLKKAMKIGQGLPGFKSITQLARGNLKGALTSLAKQGLSTALRMNPATAAGMTALKGLGFNPLGDSEMNRHAWNNYTAVAREAYDHLAENLNENSDQPVEASRQAATAFQSALQKVQSRTNGSSTKNRKVHRIQVRPGESITLIIKGI